MLPSLFLLELYEGEIKLNIVKDGYDLEYTLAFVHCTFPKSKFKSISSMAMKPINIHWIRTGSKPYGKIMYS